MRARARVRHLVALARALVADEGFGRHVVKRANGVVSHDVGRVVALDLIAICVT